MQLYIHELRAQLGDTVCSKPRVYMDMNFWILCRDVSTGKRTDKPAIDLYEGLCRRVDQDGWICPVHEAIYAELLKQRNVSSAQATARVIDQLSGGICLAHRFERIEIEMRYFLNTLLFDPSDYSFDRHVWTKVGCLLGSSVPELQPLNTVQRNTVQKTWFDEMWDFSLFDIVLRTAGTSGLTHDYAASARRINEGIQSHATEVNSFRNVYESEIKGSVNLFAREALRMLRTSTVKKIEGIFDLTSASDTEALAAVENFLETAVVDKPEVVNKYLKSLHVGACCHASIRLDQGRKFK